MKKFDIGMIILWAVVCVVIITANCFFLWLIVRVAQELGVI